MMRRAAARPLRIVRFCPARKKAVSGEATVAYRRDHPGLEEEGSNRGPCPLRQICSRTGVG